MFKFLMGLLVICLPVMFYINIGTKINVSVADFLLPLILIYQIIFYRNTDISKEKSIFIYSFTIIFAMLISLLASAYSNNLNDLLSGLANLLKIIINFLYAILIITFLSKSDNNDLFFLKTWNITATIFAILGIVGVTLYYLGKNTIFTLSYRLDGTFNDPNLAALYLIISLIFSQVYCYKYLKKSININSIIILSALILTVSRGGILSFLIGIVITIIFYFPHLNMRKIIYIILAFSFLLIFFFLADDFFKSDLISTIITRLQSIDTDDNSTKYRVLLWDTAFNLWVENPLFGVGSGQFTSIASKYLGYKIIDIPHNTYFGFLAELGIIGFVAFASLPLYYLIKLKNMMKSNDIIALYLFLGLLIICIQAFTINIENIRFLWIFLAYTTLLGHQN